MWHVVSVLMAGWQLEVALFGAASPLLTCGCARRLMACRALLRGQSMTWTAGPARCLSSFASRTR